MARASTKKSRPRGVKPATVSRRRSGAGKNEAELQDIEEEFLKEIGKNIRNKRPEKMPAKKLADEIGISQHVQYLRERGETSWPVTDLARYAKSLQCRPADLVPELPEPGSSKKSPKPARRRRAEPDG